MRTLGVHIVGWSVFALACSDGTSSLSSIERIAATKTAGDRSASLKTHLAALDADANGTIGDADILSLATERALAHDPDKDGFANVTPREGTYLAEIDTDGDGKVAVTELAAEIARIARRAWNGPNGEGAAVLVTHAQAHDFGMAVAQCNRDLRAEIATADTARDSFIMRDEFTASTLASTIDAMIGSSLSASAMFDAIAGTGALVASPREICRFVARKKVGIGADP